MITVMSPGQPQGIPVLRQEIPIGQTARWCEHCGAKLPPPIEEMKKYILKPHSLAAILKIKEISDLEGEDDYIQAFDKQKGETGPGRLLSHKTGTYYPSVRYARTHLRHLWYMGLFDGKMFDEDECGVKMSGYTEMFLSGQLAIPRSIKAHGGRIVASSIECAVVHGGVIVDAKTVPNIAMIDIPGSRILYSHPWPIPKDPNAPKKKRK